MQKYGLNKQCSNEVKNGSNAQENYLNKQKIKIKTK